MDIDPTKNHRILVIDDNKTIHGDFRKILAPDRGNVGTLAEAENVLFGQEAVHFPTFMIDSALQGKEGLDLVEKSLEENYPYAMAFVDVRMPPGWDGVETTIQMWRKYPNLQVVICTAYSDYSWEDMLNRLGYSDRLVILKKPFDNIEVLQLAISMTEKWRLYYQAKLRLDDLEKMVARRTIALQGTNAELASANKLLKVATEEAQKMAAKVLMASKAKSEFLANMSHEIRTPMNGVIGMVDLLMETPLTDEQREFASTIKGSADGLLVVIDDILDFSKVEVGKLTLELIEFELDELISSLINLLMPRARAKKIELIFVLQPQIPKRLAGDPSRLRQILLNLIGNAIKFTDRGTVRLEIRQTEETAERVQLEFRVEDTGIGIAEETVGELFQPFVQGDASMTRKFGGTGLGLAICRRLVELMGGTISVTSTLGQGSTFSFILEFAKTLKPREIVPETETAIHNEAGAEVAAPTSKTSRIILAEDNKINQLVGLRQLKKLGYENVRLTEDGAGTIAAWQQDPSAIILMDCQMPEMDGYEATRRIRSLESEKDLGHTAIIAMTAGTMEGDRDRCLEAGMDDYIMKPVNALELKTALDRHQEP